MEKKYEKPKAELIEFLIDCPIMDVDMNYSEGWDEDFG